MKKTIIALFTLTGVAAAETVSLVLPASGSATYGTDWQAAGQNVTDISSLLTSNKDKAAGVYVAPNTSNLANYGVNGEGTWAQTDNEGTITLCGRSGVSGDYMALVLAPTFAESDTILESITFSAGSISGVVTTYTLQVGVFTSNGASYLSSTAVYDSTKQGASVTLSIDDDLIWSKGDKVVAVLRGGSGQATSPYTVSNISLSATTGLAPTPAVPEPTTATLSLLALAGLAARRRRR